MLWACFVGAEAALWGSHGFLLDNDDVKVGISAGKS